MSLDRFETISRCLHVQVCEAQDAMKGSPSYDKVAQNWMVDGQVTGKRDFGILGKEIRWMKRCDVTKNRFVAFVNTSPVNRRKWGIKVWCGTDLKSTTCMVVWVTFHTIYCGANTIEACPN